MKQDFEREIWLIKKILDHHHAELMEALDFLGKLIESEDISREALDSMKLMFEIVAVEGQALSAEAREGILDVKRLLLAIKKLD